MLDLKRIFLFIWLCKVVVAAMCRLGCCGAQGLVALWHVDPSSPTRDQACIPGIGRQFLNFWTTREVLKMLDFDPQKPPYAKLLQSCLTLQLCSPPGSTLHEMLQARIQERVAISSSRVLPAQRLTPRLLCLLHRQASSLPLVALVSAVYFFVFFFFSPKLLHLRPSFPRL